jgi:hypothetical protein
MLTASRKLRRPLPSAADACWRGSDVSKGIEGVVGGRLNTPKRLLGLEREMADMDGRRARLKGAATRVSADRPLDKRTDELYYAAKIRLLDEGVAEHNGVRIVPGMPTQVFIKTGRSTVALHALRPLLDSFSGAFREH